VIQKQSQLVDGAASQPSRNIQREAAIVRTAMIDTVESIFRLFAAGKHSRFAEHNGSAFAVLNGYRLRPSACRQLPK